MNINHNDIMVHHIPAPERHVDAPKSDWQLALQKHKAAIERFDQLSTMLTIQQTLMEVRAATKKGSAENRNLTDEIQRTGSRIRLLRAQVAS